MEGRSENFWVNGSSFVDASDGNDLVLGSNGPDYIIGGLVRDYIAGGSGNDFTVGARFWHDEFATWCLRVQLPAVPYAVARETTSSLLEGGNIVCGDEGDDQITGGSGSEML